ncbi:eotaxin-like [Heterodontus francisci]|uniref:eotaxin-like n=1 Tax=Heterodontus francisci TaxID=7792 RepID=UPI00355AD9B9
MKQVLVVLICLSIFMLVVSAAPNPIWKNCCRRYSKTVPRFNRIEDYTMQENDGRCKIKAVLFKVRGRKICSDPNDERVQKLVEKLSQKEQRG